MIHRVHDSTFSMNGIVEIRLEFLKMEGMGFSLCEIVKELSVKYHKTERTIYYDAETRKTWQPLFTQLFDLDKARLVVMNRYEWIYRQAAKELILGKATDKSSALKIMLDVTKNLVNLLGLESVKQTQDKEFAKMFQAMATVSSQAVEGESE